MSDVGRGLKIPVVYIENTLVGECDFFIEGTEFYNNLKFRLCLAILHKLQKDLNCNNFSYLNMVRFYKEKCSSIRIFNAVKYTYGLDKITYDELIITAQRIGMTKEKLFKYI